MLDAAAGIIARKQRTARVVRMRGVEARVERPWSGLTALADDLGGLDCLAPARAVAVRTALSIESTNAAVEPFAVALGARDLLVNAAESGPVVVFVDDLHWVDLATRRTLSFVARRLQFERVAMVSTRRSGTDPRPTPGLSSPSTLSPTRWPTASSPMPVWTARAFVVSSSAHAAGSRSSSSRRPGCSTPTSGRKRGAARSAAGGSSGQRVVGLMIERLPSSALTALLVAAAETDGDLVHITDALARLGREVGDLEVAEGHGLVTIDGDRLRFRHPLMRSVVYHRALPADRRAAHRALADSHAGAAALRAWHHALAATAPDEAVARALDDAAAVTNRRGAPAVAGRSWELASRLSPAVEDRVRRLRLAADALLDAGMAPAAGRLLGRAEQAIDEAPQADDVVERVRRQQLRCRLPSSSGGEANPAAGLRSAAREVPSVSPAVAVDVLLDALAAYVVAGALGDIIDTVEEAIRLRDVVDADRARRIDVIHGALLLSRTIPLVSGCSTATSS